MFHNICHSHRTKTLYPIMGQKDIVYVSRAKEGKRLLEEEKNQNEKYDRILKTFDEYKSKQDDLEKTRNKHQMITIHPGRRVFLSGWIEVIYEFFCK